MTVPLDRLYYYIQNISQEIYNDCVLIYRFWPHGSKKLNNLQPLNSRNWSTAVIFPGIYCNDQEPLDYDFYKDQAISLQEFGDTNNVWHLLLKSINSKQYQQNLNIYPSIFNKSLLIHSEKRSAHVEKYQIDNKLIPVYYWSHALIARDWFRYAEHETFKKTYKNTFLVYNRAWSGTREYRLKFADLLVQSHLHDHCQTSFNPSDPELDIHYNNFKLKNCVWQPTQILENFFPPTHISSNASADFNTIDYNNNNIEVILETLFDDNRLHLTEKSLRPIACAMPFIMVGTHGSLNYLHNYGFKTYDKIWNESYDQIKNPIQRLRAVIDLMKDIISWDSSTKKYKLAQAQEIADYNRRWFFSEDFTNLIANELKINLQSAFDILHQDNDHSDWINRWNHLTSHKQVTEFLDTNQNSVYPTKEQFNTVKKVIEDKSH
jgi:hypothetical protein